MSGPYTSIDDQHSTQRSAWNSVFGVGRTRTSHTTSGPASSYGALGGDDGHSGTDAGECCSKGECSSNSTAPVSCSSVVVHVEPAGCCSTAQGANSKTCSSSGQATAVVAPSPVRDGGPVLTWLQLALALAWFSVFWNLAEAGAGLYAGIANMQLSVLANAGQSGCEVISASLVLFRLQADAHINLMTPAQIVARERIGIRVMGGLFCALAVGVIGGCIPRFISKAVPADTLPGLIVSAAAAAAMIVCFVLKRAASKKLNSSTLAEDANCSLFCFQLSVLVIIGSLIHMHQAEISAHCSYRVCDLWWVDSSLACALSLVIFRDGVRSIRVSYAADFNGGCGCCSGNKGKQTEQSSIVTPVDQRTVSPVQRINGDQGADCALLSHPCASSSAAHDTAPVISDLVEEHLEERTASPLRSGHASAQHSEDDDIDVYDD